MADVRTGSDVDTRSPDAWFDLLERMPVPEGYRVEIVGGNVHMTPQRETHWRITCCRPPASPATGTDRAPRSPTCPLAHLPGAHSTSLAWEP